MSIIKNYLINFHRIVNSMSFDLVSIPWAYLRSFWEAFERIKFKSIVIDWQLIYIGIIILITDILIDMCQSNRNVDGNNSLSITRMVTTNLYSFHLITKRM